MQCIERLSGVSGLPWGGYAQAERVRLVLGNEEAIAAASGDPAQAGGVAALGVRGNFIFDPATHRDFLGALLGTGIERQKVGDVLVQGETGAQILVVPELVDHAEFNLTQVRSVSVVARAVPLMELVMRQPKVQEMRSVEASLRLDAVASAGLRVSRAKAADLAKRGDLRVKWRVAKGSALVKAGDVISASGMGRLEVTDVAPTRKGRWAVAMVRYV
ncbi:hypothetical protein WJX81_005131 [Elliptochloris bilobata]|uniref:Ribosome-associated protein quality control protein P2 RNA-binding domain-containing protein n=1 Tax=Elliptochloris bilobata TaxID=381761 RepID=A0AAW1SA30_9CHLO